MENSENRDLTLAGVTDQSTFFEFQKARNPSKYWGFVVPVVGLEPTRCRQQRILSRCTLTAVNGKQDPSEGIKGREKLRQNLIKTAQSGKNIRGVCLCGFFVKMIFAKEFGGQMEGI